MLGSLCLVLTLASTTEPLPLLALANFLGAAGGLLGFGLVRALARVPRRARPFTYVLLGGCLMLVYVALPLGAWTKLYGPHRTMAIAALLGSALSGAALGCHVYWTSLLRGLKPTGRIGWLFAVSAPIGLLLLALVLATYEATQTWLRSYPSARQALFGGAWYCATAGVLRLLRLLPRRALRGVVAGTASVAGIGLAGLALVDKSSWSTLTRVPHAERWVGFARALTDFDGDGFSGWVGGGDCEPFNPKVSPGAAEIRGNGVDDNCRYGDAPALQRVEVTTAPPTPAGPDALSIVLVTVDALRADRTTPYGYVRDTTPNLAAFGQGAVRFEHAYTSGGWTCLAISSLFSGVYPRRLRWKPFAYTSQFRLLELPFEKAIRPDETVFTTITLPVQTPGWWLPSALQQRGYHTAAISSLKVRPMFSRSFTPGWDRFVIQDGIDDADTVDLALQELKQLRSPFLLWVHLFEPHDPQTVHPGAPHFGESLSDGYDHEVASMDQQLARLLRALDGQPRTAVIITADHGETLASGFQVHGVDLWEDILHIPLLVRAPGWQPGVNSSPASLVDLAPTIAALTQTPLPSGLDGRNLKDLTGDASVISDMFRLDERGRLALDEMTATNRTLRLWRDNRNQAEALVHTGDLGRPPVMLPAEQAPLELVEALGRYIEGSLPP